MAVSVVKTLPYNARDRDLISGGGNKILHETSARTWCSGRTWRERVEREVGGGIGMGKTCKLEDVSFQCMTKFTTN